MPAEEQSRGEEGAEATRSRKSQVPQEFLTSHWTTEQRQNPNPHGGTSAARQAWGIREKRPVLTPGLIQKRMQLWGQLLGSLIQTGQGGGT